MAPPTGVRIQACWPLRVTGGTRAANVFWLYGDVYALTPTEVTRGPDGYSCACAHERALSGSLRGVGALPSNKTQASLLYVCVY